LQQPASATIIHKLSQLLKTIGLGQVGKLGTELRAPADSFPSPVRGNDSRPLPVRTSLSSMWMPVSVSHATPTRKMSAFRLDFRNIVFSGKNLVCMLKTTPSSWKLCLWIGKRTRGLVKLLAKHGKIAHESEIRPQDLNNLGKCAKFSTLGPRV